MLTTMCATSVSVRVAKHRATSNASTAAMGGVLAPRGLKRTGGADVAVAVVDVAGEVDDEAAVISAVAVYQRCPTCCADKIAIAPNKVGFTIADAFVIAADRGGAGGATDRVLDDTVEARQRRSIIPLLASVRAAETGEEAIAARRVSKVSECEKN